MVSQDRHCKPRERRALHVPRRPPRTPTASSRDRPRAARRPPRAGPAHVHPLQDERFEVLAGRCASGWAASGSSPAPATWSWSRPASRTTSPTPATRTRSSVTVTRGDRIQIRGVELCRRQLPALDEAERVLRAVAACRRRQPSDGRRHAEEVTLAGGRVDEDVVQSERLARLVLVPDVDDVERVRGRLHIGELQLRPRSRRRPGCLPS